MASLNDMTIQGFEIIQNYTIRIEFSDGKIQEINFHPVVGHGWMEELADLQYFVKVKLNDGGNLEWPNGQDFNPEALYDWENFKQLYIDEANKNVRSA